jgi:Zn-dependent peptidase ImmA (M78 family)
MFARGFKTWCENAAVELRRTLRLQRIDPLAPEQLANHLGVRLCTPREIPGLSSRAIGVLLDSERSSWSAVTLSSSDQTLVIYNSSHAPGRRANDIMHELAHILLGHKPARVMFFPDGQLALRTYDQDQEEQATWLAACLLLPRECLVHIRVSGLDESVAAEHYQVTITLLSYRMDITGVNHQFRRRRRSGGS